MVGEACDLVWAVPRSPLGSPGLGERLKGLDNVGMEHPPLLVQQAPVGHFLGEGMLEGIGRLRDQARLIGFPGASEKFCTLACPTPGSEGTPGSAMLVSLRRYVIAAARLPRAT